MTLVKMYYSAVMFMAAKDNSESDLSVIGSLVDTIYGMHVKHILPSKL